MQCLRRNKFGIVEISLLLVFMIRCESFNLTTFFYRIIF
ncbi:Uncharacterized protein dnm_079180 [Desulfonema magnum]|uniref:Uncharacterized protein n=1 Tax=Desulfonema magnum TaxID=45655 RepID=A0A975GSB0_9BACT|nr:Uncharacterized protein dnm_079180 [Desulfonema magnum]